MARRWMIAATLVLVAGAAMAQVSMIGARQELLKGNAAAAGVMAAMVKGEQPFDLAKVKASLATIAANAKKLPDMFPEDSKTGAPTAALPIIWEQKADFVARFGKLAKDAEAAMVSITDEASLKAQIGGVTGNCGGCHQTYRGKKS